MKKYISIFLFILIFSVLIISIVEAKNNATPSDNLSNLTYPIAELGSCKSQADCKVYCDKTINIAACVSYSEKKNLLSQQDLQLAKNFVAVGAKGPGNCNGKLECQAYCEYIANINECVSYAENNDLMSAEDLQKAKKVQAAINKGVKFPACKTEKECDVYCAIDSNIEECTNFAVAAGLVTLEEAKVIMETRGSGRGANTGGAANTVPGVGHGAGGPGDSYGPGQGAGQGLPRGYGGKGEKDPFGL